MNPPFSPAQAGRSFVVNLDQSIPHDNCSQSTFELTILGSCLQNVLQRGFALHANSNHCRAKVLEQIYVSFF